jgi:5-methylcytosine-specific restriction endonuclease McrA
MNIVVANMTIIIVTQIKQIVIFKIENFLPSFFFKLKQMSKQTTYNSSRCQDKVWDLAKTIKNQDSNLYRQDPYGNKICKKSYGKDTEQGWNIDHIKPSSRGGSDNLRNLQALQTTLNKSKGNTLVKKSRHNN